MEIMDKFFFGSAISSVDERGGILLPAGIIETLKERQADGVVFVGRHEDGQRLVVYDKAYFDDQRAGIGWQNGALIGGTKETHEQFLLRTFTFVEKVELTDLGQIAISRIMRACGRIGDSILMIGAGQHFELWDLQTVIKNGPSDLRWLAQRHVAAQSIGEQNVECDRAGKAPISGSVVTLRTRRATPRRVAKVQAEPLPMKIHNHRQYMNGV